MKKFVMAAVLAAAAGSATAGQDYLVVGYGSFPDYEARLASVIQGLGYNVDLLSGAQPGQVAQRLANNNYDSIFIFDVGTFLNANQADADALDAWYGSQRPIIIDGRSYGLMQGNPTEEGNLIENVATVFDNRGGGLWVGTDHDPGWAYNGNHFLQALGYNPVVGLTASANLQGDMNSDYLSTPNSININNLNWGGSVGVAPEGVQPNGIELFRILWNAGTDEPMITGNEVIPAPGAAGVLVLGGIAAARRRR